MCRVMPYIKPGHYGIERTLRSLFVFFREFVSYSNLEEDNVPQLIAMGITHTDSSISSILANKIEVQLKVGSKVRNMNMFLSLLSETFNCLIVISFFYFIM